MKKPGSVIHLGRYSLMFIGEQEVLTEKEVIKEYEFQLESYCSRKITITSKDEINIEVGYSIGTLAFQYPRYRDEYEFNSFNREFFITLLIVRDQVLEVESNITKYNLLFDKLEQNSILKNAIEQKNKYKINETQRILSNIKFELSLYEDQDLKEAWELVNIIAPGYRGETVG